MVEGSNFFRVVLQLTHGCTDLGFEIGPIGDRHTANSVGLEMFPDKLIGIAVRRIGWKIKQPQSTIQALDNIAVPEPRRVPARDATASGE